MLFGIDSGGRGLISQSKEINIYIFLTDYIGQSLGLVLRLYVQLEYACELFIKIKR